MEDTTNAVSVYDAFWNEIDNNYSFFSYTDVNWDSVYVHNKKYISPELSNDSLFKVLTEMADMLGDAHTNIYAPMGIGGGNDYFEKFQVNEVNTDESLFENYQTGRLFEYGKLKDSEVGYIKIKTFEGEAESFSQIDSILFFLSFTRSLIIDVRSNRGGKISNCDLVASRFSDTAIYAGKYRIRNGPDHGDFSDWINVYTPWCKPGYFYRNPVVLLTNRTSYSATEWFIMYAGVLPNFTIIGDTTGGGSGKPVLRELPNGWIVRISNTQMQILSGRDFQFAGLYPDIPVMLKKEDYTAGYDRILDFAINLSSVH